MRRRGHLVSMAFVIAGITSACQSSERPAGPVSGAAMRATPVVLTVAREKPIEAATEYVASLKSLRSTTVQPQTDGRIIDIFVRSGDRVGQGSPVAQIDPQRQQAAVSSQQAERAAREAALTLARQQAGRLNELYAAGAASKQEQEQAAAALETAEANLKALDAQIEQQQVQLRYYTVAAPTAGIVGDVPVRIGTQVTSDTVLTTIDQNETLELNVAVPVERASDLKRGLPVQILSGDAAQTLATTAINFVSPRVADDTQSVLVKAEVRNPDGRLRASQNVRARIIWKTTTGLVVPVTAVVRINGQFFAFVADDAGGRLVARQRAIKAGPIVGEDYSILEGIKPGERVVTSGAQKLADGVPIAPQEAGASPDRPRSQP